MHCPDCGHDRTRVVDTGASNDGTSVRRRRECQRCSFRFTTYERPEWDSLQVKKRDGEIEPYRREKLRAGVERAVEKRPVDDDAVDELVDDVEAELRETDTRIVNTSVIGDLVSSRLKALDSVAYIRFVSVYEAFSEPEEFLRELDAVLDEELPDHGSSVEDAGDGDGHATESATTDDGASPPANGGDSTPADGADPPSADDTDSPPDSRSDESDHEPDHDTD